MATTPKFIRDQREERWRDLQQPHSRAMNTSARTAAAAFDKSEPDYGC